MQEAFVELCRHWERVREYERPDAWLLRSAISRLRNERRRIGRLARHLLRLQPAGDDLAAPTPLHHELKTAFQRLPARQREAAALHFLLGLSIEEVADSMDISPGAASSHLHRARKVLCSLLEDWHE